jgi:hypothetical protein
VGHDGTFAGETDPESPSCPPGTSQATTPLMTHVWIVDNACGHRFGGVGVEGQHCAHDMGHGDDPTTTRGMVMTWATMAACRHRSPSPAAPPTQPVADQPTFTG